MADMDARLIAALRRDGRASLSQLAVDLGLSRATVRVRLTRLIESEEIAGFTVLTRADVAPHPVRGLMMLGIEGRGTERIRGALLRRADVASVHSTNGTWDLIVELGTETLEDFDAALFAIRRMEGVQRSETNLLLSTRRGGAG
ncbi:Lrp/AsnC family transcriptional regulator [Aestuariibius insulae]|uniref:Lrp/AsnC family transcriptional regulator n=1 Tax=Aestuariibius insulae TaxID=2058287 RepID=UPI00345EB8D9